MPSVKAAFLLAKRRCVQSRTHLLTSIHVSKMAAEISSWIWSLTTDLNNTGSRIQYILPLKFWSHRRHFGTPDPVCFAGMVNICYAYVATDVAMVSINWKSCGGHLGTPNSWISGFILAVGWVIQYYSDSVFDFLWQLFSDKNGNFLLQKHTRML